jgi:hypothetical protein
MFFKLATPGTEYHSRNLESFSTPPHKLRLCTIQSAGDCGVLSLLLLLLRTIKDQ